MAEPKIVLTVDRDRYSGTTKYHGKNIRTLSAGTIELTRFNDDDHWFHIKNIADISIEE